MIDQLPDGPDPANDIPAVFSQKAAAFVIAQRAMIPQINSAIANINSIAAGGAYAIPFQVAVQVAIGGAGGGKLACEASASSLAAATLLYVDQLDSRGLSCRTLLDEMYYSGNNLNAVRGYVKLTKAGDPSQWITFRITNWAAVGSTYGVLSVSCTGFSSINPFFIGDTVVASFQRTGDKGDTGPMNTLPTLIVRDQQASGVAGQALSSGAWSTRRLNTANINSLSGASLGTAGANRITLPAGTYIADISAEAVATQAGLFKHQIRLYNQTDGTLTDAGTSEYQNINATNSHFVGTRSSMHTYFVITAPKDFTIDHYSSLTATGGYANSATGSVEIYTEARFIKIA